MKKFVAILAAPSLLALGACGEADAPTPEETMEPMDGTTADGTMTDPAMTDGTMDAEMDGDSTTVSASEDGMTADVQDGNTSVQADLDEDPSATVTTED
jgi:major membrane immunogen (membrane-anchored lipoprotein)